jgi:peptidoglycan/LPS O-acetylase OafA/YrhL
VAAIYVLLFHYAWLDSSTSHNPVVTFLQHGYLAVDLFFVLSGFVMTMTYSHLFASGFSRAAYLKFLGRRIARIYPLYLVAALAGFIGVSAGWLAYTHLAPMSVSLFLNIIMVQAWGFVGSFDSPEWSISAEWAAYLLFPTLLIPTMFRKAASAWLAALVSAGTLALLCAFPMHSYNLRAPLNIGEPGFALPVVRCVCDFVLGLLAFRLGATSVGRYAAASRWLGPALCLLTVALIVVPKSDLAVVLLFPFVVVVLSSDVHIVGRALSSPFAQLLGKLSFSIYLTHKLLLGTLFWIDGRARSAGLAHAHLYAVGACIALTAIIATIAYRTIEVPGRRWLRELFEGPLGDTITRGTLCPTVQKL